MKNFCIRLDYISRNKIKYQDTSTRTDEYQNDVYKYAHEIAFKYNLINIADIGCGSGYKLLKYFDNFKTIGFDLKLTVDLLNQKYPDRIWKVSNFEESVGVFDMVICADVIEHVLNPNDLLSWIKSMQAQHIIISTPERDSLVRKGKRTLLGPPENNLHIREWNFKEFKKYVGSYFNIIEHKIIEREDCQLIYCK